jgi:hypothetical protein
VSSFKIHDPNHKVGIKLIKRKTMLKNEIENKIQKKKKIGRKFDIKIIKKEKKTT